MVELIHRSFLLPSCKVDLSRYHPRACLQYYIHRCLGPCVEGLTTPDAYKQAVRDAQLFLEGRQMPSEASASPRGTLTAGCMKLSRFEAAARILRDQLSTVHQLQEKQRIATAELNATTLTSSAITLRTAASAVNLFHSHIRSMAKSSTAASSSGKICRAFGSGQQDPTEHIPRKRLMTCPRDRQRERKIGLRSAQCAPFNCRSLVFYALLKQLYIDQQYVPRFADPSAGWILMNREDACCAAHRAHRPPDRNRSSAAR